MAKKYFWRQTICTLTLFVAFNVLVGIRASRHSVPMQLLRHMDAVPHPNLVFVGNSLIAAGVNEEVVTRLEDARTPRLSCLNIGLGATGPITHLILLRRLFQRQPMVDTCVYGFFDFQLTEPDTRLPDGNNSLCYYLEPEVAAKYYAKTWSDKIRFEIIRRVPYLREQLLVWGSVEKLRRRLAQVGMPPVNTNGFGRAEDFKALESANTTTFDAQCQETVSRSEPLTAPVAALLHLAHLHTRRLVIVEMPQPSDHRRAFYRSTGWRVYRPYVQRLVETQGAEYIDASAWAPSDGDFSDPLHLNAEGAQTFSTKIMQALYPRR